MKQARNEHKEKLLREIVKVVGEHERFAIFSHEEPDGDAIGSQVALTLALRELGKSVVSVRLDNVPPCLGFLNRDNTIEKYDPEKDNEKILEADVTFTLDTCDYFRMGDIGNLVKGSPSLKINIDHHRDNAFFGDIDFVRFIAGGTAEMVFEVIKALGVTIEGIIAEAIYIGLSTDTLGFKYIDPDGNMIVVISELVKGGIRIEDLQERLYYNRPDTYLTDLANILEKVHYEENGAIAWFVFKKREQLTYYQRELTSEALHQLLSMKRVRAAVMLHEERTGVEVWLRSKTDVDVGKAAENVGGGGHRTAAGALIRGASLDEAIQEVLANVKAAFTY
ncbi:MAG: DHH family phosphoesterase [Candidatus Tritonobacter lacicola]|nr:DHH family phosphoesterase [Candidatus Tritonobacter lacicola]